MINHSFTNCHFEANVSVSKSMSPFFVEKCKVYKANIFTDSKAHAFVKPDIRPIFIVIVEI